MRARPRSAAVPPPGALALAGLLAGGCYVGLPDTARQDSGEGGSSDAGGVDDAGDDDGPVDPRMFHGCDDDDAQLRGTSHDAMRRLSSTELRHTLVALLGESVVADEGIETRLAGLPVDATVIAGDFATDPPVGLALALAGISTRAAELTLTDPAWVQARLPACVAAGAIDDGCATAVARELGARVWRRDLTDAEVAEYVATFTSAGGGSEGLAYLVRRLLQAPSLVFHIEDGTGEPVDGRIRLGDFEVASRISYATADTMPDDALMAAARAGELDSVEAVESHVRRLLAEESAVVKVSDFFRYYSHLTSVADPLPEVASLDGIEAVDGLGAQMQDEAYEFFEYVVWSDDGDFSELMGSTAAFPRSPDLAGILGTEPVSGSEPAVAAAHTGLLHRPALLASGGARTSPILRGAHVRKLFLCDALGLPDPAAVMERQDELGDIEAMSNREKITRLTEAPACTGCHSLVNPIGFTFEGYDQLGAVRAEERIVDADGNVVATWPIDTAVDLQLESDGPAQMSDSAALAAAMVESYKARACFAQRVFEYYRLRVADERDECVLFEEELQTHDGSLVDVFVAAIANEDIFWRKAP